MSGVAAHRRPRWDLPDVLWCWLAGVVAVQIVAVIAQAAGVDPLSTGAEFGLFVPAQTAATLACAAFVSRARGLGTLRADFGFTLQRQDAPFLVVGVALQIVALVVLTPITRLAHLEREPQQLVQATSSIHAPLLIVVVIAGTVIAAPVVEELVFRGILLRSLLRRTTEGWAIAVSAFVFAAVHVVFDTGAGYVFPGLFGLGMVLGVVAMHNRTLSRPILIHAGFNLLAIVLSLMHI